MYTITNMMSVYEGGWQLLIGELLKSFVEIVTREEIDYEIYQSLTHITLSNFPGIH